MNVLCWLWPLISAVICGILGYLLGKFLGRKNSDDIQWKNKYELLFSDLESCRKAKLDLEHSLKSSKGKQNKIDLSEYTTKIKALEADLEQCRKKSLSLEAELKLVNNKLASTNLDQYTSKITKLEADLLNFKSKNSLLQSELDVSKNSLLDESDWKVKVAGLQSDLVESKAKISELELQLAKASKTDVDLGVVSSSFTAVQALIPFDAQAAKAVFGKKIKQDDLKVIEGIGPKIEQLFHRFDIKTWKLLSETSIDKCQEILDSGGERYKIHNPGTWPKQAQLAYEGKWAELLKWQDELDGGRA